MPFANANFSLFDASSMRRCSEDALLDLHPPYVHIRPPQKPHALMNMCTLTGAAQWVLHAGDTNSQSVINHNPLPDIPHEEFISLMGPLLVPEHYPSPESPLDSPTLSPPPLSPNDGAPFEWIHFEGRSVKSTLSNLHGLDGLARERCWRSLCVSSVDIGRHAKQGIEALIPHADVLLNSHYAQAQSPAYASAPRAFLLALTRLTPPHALLVAYWGADGAAALSVSTREYFQFSGWSAPSTPAAGAFPFSPSPPRRTCPRRGITTHEEAQSQRVLRLVTALPCRAVRVRIDSDCTEITGGSSNDGSRTQGPAGQSPASGARGKQQAAKQRADDVARRTSGSSGLHGGAEDRWKLDECLRFATELAGVHGTAWVRRRPGSCVMNIE
ncbi:hypothetical protein EDB89DRAFT_2232475 [Lactarius sanguifluus]|nr:hypothetical protein EDB89DRAFT_2232475 [Lactarius sanguifluus]